MNENTFARTDDTSIGFKACHTEADGWSIAAGAERKQMKCIAVVLGCQTDDSRFALAKSLLRRGFAGWQVVQPAFSAEFLYPVTVRGGICRSVLVEPKRLQGLVVPKSDQELETVLVLPRYVLAPVKKGDSVLDGRRSTTGTLCWMKRRLWHRILCGCGILRIRCHNLSSNCLNCRV